MSTFTHDFTLGEPQLVGSLAVFPIFGPPPRLAYRAFSQAAELGALVKELDEGASVRELLVHNPTDLPLLLYEGEEVLGAQQNRTFDASTLVPAGATLRVPVSCVERGRWDGSRSRERFTPSPQAADPGLRRAKRRSANLHAAAGCAASPDQGAVWHAVDERLAEHRIASPSAAMSDAYDGRRADIRSLTRVVRHREGQTGALAQVGGRPVALDLVSRPDVFAALLPRLAQGYALEALGAPTDAGPDADAAQAFATAALHAPRAVQPTPGMGAAFGVVAPELVGSGLEHEGELVQLSAFPAEDGRGRPGPVAGRIARPARRRHIL
jgi:hypothetical protein